MAPHRSGLEDGERVKKRGGALEDNVSHIKQNYGCAASWKIVNSGG